MIVGIRIFLNWKILILRIFLTKTTVSKNSKNKTNSKNKILSEYKAWTLSGDQYCGLNQGIHSQAIS